MVPGAGTGKIVGHRFRYSRTALDAWIVICPADDRIPANFTSLLVAIDTNDFVQVRFLPRLAGWWQIHFSWCEPRMEKEGNCLHRFVCGRIEPQTFSFKFGTKKYWYFPSTVPWTEDVCACTWWCKKMYKKAKDGRVGYSKRMSHSHQVKTDKKTKHPWKREKKRGEKVERRSGKGCVEK